MTLMLVTMAVFVSTAAIILGASAVAWLASTQALAAAGAGWPSPDARRPGNEMAAPHQWDLAALGGRGVWSSVAPVF